MKDELKVMEAYLKELEALRYYPQVKEERDFLTVEATQLKEKVAQLEAQLRTEIATKIDLTYQLSKRETETKELAGRLDEAQKELSLLREFKVKFADGGELILEEMKAELLHVEEDEIQRRAKERLTALEKDIQKRMPTLVHQKLMQVLKRPDWPPEIAKVIDSRAGQIADGILGDRDEWPDWFKSYCLGEVNALVNQHLTAEFERKVQAEAEKRLHLMKAEQWEEFAACKARALATSLKGLLKELQGTWWFTCDRCGRRLAVDLRPSDVGLLLRGETIEIACTTCLDPAPFPFILSSVQHKIVALSLEELLELYMSSAPP